VRLAVDREPGDVNAESARSLEWMGIQREEYPCPKWRDTSKKIGKSPRRSWPLSSTGWPTTVFRLNKRLQRLQTPMGCQHPLRSACEDSWPQGTALGAWPLLSDRWWSGWRPSHEPKGDLRDDRAPSDSRPDAHRSSPAYSRTISAAVAWPTRRWGCSKGREVSVRLKQYDKKGVAAKETILRVHLVPSLGAKRLDAITNEVVQSVKRSLREKSAKTVNNVLTALNKMLKDRYRMGGTGSNAMLDPFVAPHKSSGGISWLRCLWTFGWSVEIRLERLPDRHSKAKQVCGAAKWWRLSGRMLTLWRVNSAWNGRSGKVTSPRPRVGIRVSFHWQEAWRPLYGSIDTSKAVACRVPMTVVRWLNDSFKDWSPERHRGQIFAASVFMSWGTRSEDSLH